jgi:hypothetical protein
MVFLRAFSGLTLELAGTGIAGVFDLPNLDIPYHFPTANYSRLDE